MTFEEDFPSMFPKDFPKFNMFCPSEKEYISQNCLDKERVKEAINNIYTFIRIDKDSQNKVTMKEVDEGLNELKIILKLEEK